LLFDRSLFQPFAHPPDEHAYCGQQDHLSRTASRQVDPCQVGGAPTPVPRLTTPSSRKFSQPRRSSSRRLWARRLPKRSEIPTSMEFRSVRRNASRLVLMLMSKEEAGRMNVTFEHRSSISGAQGALQVYHAPLEIGGSRALSEQCQCDRKILPDPLQHLRGQHSEPQRNTRTPLQPRWARGLPGRRCDVSSHDDRPENSVFTSNIEQSFKETLCHPIAK
jgi:hypothetical protein